MSFFTLVRWSVFVGCFSTIVGIVGSPVVHSQTSTTRMESSSTDEQQFIREGAELRASRRWVEAIELYEKGLKTWPESKPLTKGLRQSKIQFSIDRRYSDNSFLNAMLPLSRTESLFYFDDVTDKVRRYYVEYVGPTILLAHGTESFYFALNNEKFLSRNLPGIETSRVTKVRTTLRNSYWNKPVSSQDHAKLVINELCDFAERELGLKPGCVVMEYVFGACNSLDDYSSYLTPGKLDDLYNNIDGEFVGIGIEMKAEPGKGLLLLNVLQDSPAEESGATSGDYIVGIEGRDSRNMSTEEAAQLLQGLSGSRLRLTLADGENGTERQAGLIRRAVKVRSIPVAEIIDRANGIAYIRMAGFQKNTVEELDTVLLKLNREGMQALIWDVRGNPGGLLTAAVEVLDRFIENGVLVSTRGRTNDADSIYNAQAHSKWRVPLVLLTDEDSASASEIVAGAIRDHHRGTIVGRKTYGKWSVQTILPGQADTGFRLTTAKFYSPNGKTYGKVGIEPDITIPQDSSRSIVKRPKKGDSLNDDRDVEAGLDVLRKQLARR